MSRRVLVTGASRGFGAALVEAFRRRGDQVFAGMRGLAGARETAGDRSARPVVSLGLDVINDRSVEAAFAAVAERISALDVLVNNAAIRSPSVMNPIERIDLADAANTYEVNALGPLRVVKTFLPLLQRGTSPILVNVSSEAGSIGECRRDREFDYCMSKAALNMSTALLANHLRGKVRVLSLHPGWLRTDMGGAHAELDPRAAAEQVVDLLDRESRNPNGALFLDHLGRTMPW